MAGNILTAGDLGRLQNEITTAPDDHLPIYDVSGKIIGFTTPAALSGVGTPINAGATLAMTAAEHAGKLINLNTAAGSVVTLPAATGSGNVYKFRVSVLATSNSHIVKAASAADSFDGIIVSGDDTSDNAVAFKATAGTSDTITLNRSTTGSVTIGETIVITDVAAGRFNVTGLISNTGTPATPFSATVS